MNIPSFVRHLAFECFMDVVPMERPAWTSMSFPGYRPAFFEDVPIAAIMTLEPQGTGTRYVFTALPQRGQRRG